MALIKCRECGKEYSSLAKACPNCGCPTKYSINQNHEPIKYRLLGFERKLDDVLSLNAVITPDSYQQKVFLKFDIGGHNIIDYASDLLSFVFSDLDALKTMLINGDETMTITKDSLILKQNNITIKQIKQLNDGDYWHRLCNQDKMYFCTNEKKDSYYTFAFFIYNNELRMGFFIENFKKNYEREYFVEEQDLMDFGEYIRECLNNHISEYIHYCD